VVNLDRFVDQFAPRLFFFSSYFEPVANGAMKTVRLWGSKFDLVLDPSTIHNDVS
jgi:hypothetical protein